MNLKRFFIKHTYAIFTAIILIMLAFFTTQIMIMKSDFTETMKITDSKLAEDLADAMLKRERQINRLQAGISQDNLRRWDIIAADKIIGRVNKRLPEEIRYEYATYIIDEVNRYSNIDLLVWLSLLSQESRFRVDAESNKDAVGLGQVIPETARWICKELGIPYHKDIRLDPKMNLKMSAWYLSFLMTEYKNDTELALAHYNGGPWQKNSWKYTRIYKNSPEYKSMAVDELRLKVNGLEEVIPYTERKAGKTPRAQTYFKYKKILRAKLLASETAAYIPEIMRRAKGFKKFYNEPNTLIPVSLDVITEVGKK